VLYRDRRIAASEQRIHRDAGIRLVGPDPGAERLLEPGRVARDRAVFDGYMNAAGGIRVGVDLDDAAPARGRIAGHRGIAQRVVAVGLHEQRREVVPAVAGELGVDDQVVAARTSRVESEAAAAGGREVVDDAN